jgi:hypothetical protein
MLVMEGLPAGVNLQESFLLTRLGASLLLRDRLRTRFTQGVGRCSRGPNDYAAVLVLGDQLFQFCARADNRAGMHPELQAEIEFGLDNSEDLTTADALNLLELFRKQGDDWKTAEEDVRTRREGKTRAEDPSSAQLASVVIAEVDYVYSLWRKDFAGALARAIAVTEGLAGPKVEGYRALWYYLAGVAAWLAGEQQDDEKLRVRARELFGRAAKASKVVPWFAELASLTSDALSSDDVEHGLAAAAIYDELSSLGFVGAQFERAMSTLEAGLGSSKAKDFEPVLSMLGRLLGWRTYKPEGDGKPDSVWVLGDQIAIGFEAKSDETPADPVSIKTVRQALTHGKTVEDDGDVATTGVIHTVVSTPRWTIDAEAQALAGDLRYVGIVKLRELGEKVRGVMRNLRVQLGTDAEPDDAKREIQKAMAANGLLPADIVKLLTATKLKSLPKR